MTILISNTNTSQLLLLVANAGGILHGSVVRRLLPSIPAGKWRVVLAPLIDSGKIQLIENNTQIQITPYGRATMHEAIPENIQNNNMISPVSSYNLLRALVVAGGRLNGCILRTVVPDIPHGKLRTVLAPLLDSGKIVFINNGVAIEITTYGRITVN
jgi:hypothetical protein